MLKCLNSGTNMAGTNHGEHFFQLSINICFSMAGFEKHRGPKITTNLLCLFRNFESFCVFVQAARHGLVSKQFTLFIINVNGLIYSRFGSLTSSQS